MGQPPPAKVQRLDVPQQQQTLRPGTAGAYVPIAGHARRIGAGAGALAGIELCNSGGHL